MSQPAAAPAAPRAAAPAPAPVAPPPAAPRPAAPASPAVAAASSGRGRMRGWLSTQVHGTPGRMRLVGAAAAIAAILFGSVGAGSLWASSGSIDRAAANTEQIVRVQSIYADVLRADADATNAFLVGGNEDPTQRADYEAAMKRAAGTLAIAAREQRADGAALAALNTELQAYAVLVEQARAYNRQGLPVGAQYQTQASDLLRDRAVPIFRSLLEANTDRSREEFGSASSMRWLVATGVLALAVLVGAAVWLARRTRRILNVGLTAAFAAVLAAFVVGLTVLGGIAGDVRRVVDNQFAGTLALTSARSAAFDAKANESLGLIARGQAGVKREPAWDSSNAQVKQQLGALQKLRWFGGSSTSAAGLATAWSGYEDTHRAVRAIDNAGDWDKAVGLATTKGQGTSRAFADFEQLSATALTGFQSSLTSDIAAPSGKAVTTAIAMLLAGLVAAVLATRGIRTRVEEYR